MKHQTRVIPQIIFTKIVSKILPKKKEVQSAHLTQSCWLVALLFAMIGPLRYCSQERIFVVLQEAMTSIFFSCPIVMSTWQWLNLYILLLRSKQGYNNTNIARSEELRYNKETQQSNFYCCWSQEATTMSISLCCIAREQAMTEMYTSQGSKRTPYCKGASNSCKGMAQPTTQPSNFICCWLQWSWQWAHIARSNDKDNIFYVLVLHRTGDSEEEMQDCASQQPTFFKVIVVATTMIAKAPKHPW